MSFQPRTFEQILNDMIAYMQSRTAISDYNVGSVIRTILEAAALEDDEQYFQMVQLLDLFSFTTASGEDLDRRLADFGLTRRSAQSATARAKFYDNNLVRTRAGADSPAAVTSITGFDTSRFPTSGYPYTIRVGEGTARLMNLLVTANNATTGVLTLSAPTPYEIFIGDRISFVTGGTLSAPLPPSASARTITIGTTLQAPPTVTESARIYSTVEPAFIIQGNYESNEVFVRCSTSGSSGNIGAGRINQFPSSPPFVGAGVQNVSQAAGGLDRETDTEFRTRALAQLQSLSRGTPLAVKTAAIGITDPVTQARVVSSNLVEDFSSNEVVLYVDDGTGSVARTSGLPADSLASAVLLGGSSLQPVSISDWPNSGYVLIESDGVNPIELVSYISNNGSVLTLASSTTSPHALGSIINFVDQITDAAEATQRRFKLTNFPVVRNTERIWICPPSGIWSLLVRDVDYKLNKGTGELQLTDVGGVVAGTKLVAHYSYYTNLIAQVQKVMEGDPDDPVNFPGVKAAGIFLSVEQPTIKRINVIASITAAEGFSEASLAPLVRSVIESYVSSLRIGQDVIVSKIIDNAFTVSGLADIRVLLPTSNVTVLESELPVPFDASGATLVQVL
jgi:uncharacterized phage protein gp47/JayE